MVHTYKQVEARRMQVDNPTECRAECAYSTVNAHREEFARSKVGRQTELGPRVIALETCGVKQGPVFVTFLV